MTPLKDRIASQILTHYPQDVETAGRITAQEAGNQPSDIEFRLTDDASRLIEEITFAARASELVDQSSGVSARVSISALELLMSNLERRALVTGATTAQPRVCDLHMLLPAITGKVEMVYEGEQKGVEMVARQIIGEAVKKLFSERYPEVGREVGSGGEDDDGPYSAIARWFAEGNEVLLSDEQDEETYRCQLGAVPGLMELASTAAPSPQEDAFGAELVLEGLHQHLKLAREDLESQITYKEMVKFQLLQPRGTQTEEA